MGCTPQYSSGAGLSNWACALLRATPEACMSCNFKGMCSYGEVCA